VQPGDAILADDDGVVIVSRSELESVLQAAQQREEREKKVRARLAAGELGLDIYDMRRKLEQLGLVYLDHDNAGLSDEAAGVSDDRAKSENERERRERDYK
jgi:4-hydroxy-4-methyl-2-oxoglutarate aldolase